MAAGLGAPRAVADARAGFSGHFAGGVGARAGDARVLAAVRKAKSAAQQSMRAEVTLLEVAGPRGGAGAGAGRPHRRRQRARVGRHGRTGAVGYRHVVMELQAIGVQHPAVRQVQHIQNNTAPNRYKLFVAEGLWAHNMLLEADAPIDTFLWCPEAIYADEAHKRGAADRRPGRARSFRVSLRTLEQISERDKPDGLLSLAALPRWDLDGSRFGRRALILVADGVEIPGNLGTLIRTLDACGADCLVLTNRRTRLTHPKVFRASHGMILTVPTVEFERDRGRRRLAGSAPRSRSARRHRRGGQLPPGRLFGPHRPGRRQRALRHRQGRGTATATSAVAVPMLGRATRSTSRSPRPSCCTRPGPQVRLVEVLLRRAWYRPVTSAGPPGRAGRWP